MSRSVRTMLVAALSLVAVGVAPRPASALSLDLPAGRYVFACDQAKTLTMNGVAVTTGGQPRRCDTLLNLTVRVGNEQTTAPSYVDLRGLTMLPPNVYLFVTVFGDARVHGSPGNDNLSADGTVYGYAGDDTLLPSWLMSNKSFTAYGGPGNDILRCHSSTRCALNGSTGNDLLEASHNGSSFGGDGDDTLTSSLSTTGPTTVDGGTGNDLVRAVPYANGGWQRLSVTPGPVASSVRVVAGLSDVTYTRIESVNAYVGPRSATVTMSNSFPIAITDGEQRSGSVTLKVPGGVWTRTDTAEGYQVTAPSLRDVTLDWRSSQLYIVPA